MLTPAVRSSPLLSLLPSPGNGLYASLPSFGRPEPRLALFCMGLWLRDGTVAGTELWPRVRATLGAQPWPGEGLRERQHLAPASLPRAEPSRLRLQVPRGWQGPLPKVQDSYKEAGQREEVFWSGSRRTEVGSGRQVGRARERAGADGKEWGRSFLLRDSGRTQRLAGREGPEEAGGGGGGGGDRGARWRGQGGQGSLRTGRGGA